MVNRNFTPFPILTTERVTLRQLSIDDKLNIFDLRSDTEINKYLDREPSKTIEDAINFIKKINDNIKNNNSIYWVISLTSTKTFVGTICLILAFTHYENQNSTNFLLKFNFVKLLETDKENPNLNIFTLAQ